MVIRERKFQISKVTSSREKTEVKNQKLFSEYNKINCGVPQGTALCPILLLLYVNNIETCIKTRKVLWYANDRTLMFSGKNYEAERSKVETILKGMKMPGKVFFHLTFLKLNFYICTPNNLIYPTIYTIYTL